MSSDPDVENRDRPLQVGEQVGDYVIKGLLGRGSFGVVYRALQPEIEKPVAIKVLAYRYSMDPSVLSRFIFEARAVNKIQHRNIIDIFTFGRLPDGRHYHVMELLIGQPLDEFLKQRGGKLPVEEAVPILRGIARALDAAHGAGIVHRDLKPANVFISRDDDGQVFPKLLDFGIAKLLHEQFPQSHQTATGAAVGTPDFMSPEQCRGPDVDHRSDIYAFGVLAFALMSGRLPFRGNSVVEAMMNHMTAPPPKFSEVATEVGPIFDGAFSRVLAKEPNKRPESTRTFVSELETAGREAGYTIQPSITLDPELRSDRHFELSEGTEDTYASGEPMAEAVSSGQQTRWMSLMLAFLSLVAVSGLVAAALQRRRMNPQVEPIHPVVTAESTDASVTETEEPPIETPVTTPVPQSTPDLQPSPTRPPVMTPPASKLVALNLKGQPVGARVYDQSGQYLGKIPMVLTVSESQEPLTLDVRASGHVMEQIEVVPDSDKTLELRLNILPADRDALEVPEW